MNKDLNKIEELLKNLPADKSPEGFSDQVMMRIQEEQQLQTKSYNIFGPTQWAVAVCLIIVIIAVSFIPGDSSQWSDFPSMFDDHLINWISLFEGGNTVITYSLLAFLSLGLLEVYLLSQRLEQNPA